jgi:hypothetical protein
MLGEPGLALDYLGRHSAEPSGTLEWGMMLPAVDPIRCDPRFRDAAKKLVVTDLRAAKICNDRKT